MSASNKTQADLKLRQAEQAYRVLNYQKAIEALTEALVIVQDYQLYTFRSKCYTAASFTQYAIDDANTAIQMQRESHEGYFCRAEAEFFQGEFELALVDYSICQYKRPDISDHQRGISKCEESIRKACECDRINQFIEWLDSGVLIEKSLFYPHRDICIETFTGQTDDYDSECSTGLNTATLFGQYEVVEEQPNKFDILNVPSGRVYREISRKAYRSQSYNRIGKMAIDREFLREVGSLNVISDISKKGIDYIDYREEFWRNYSTTQSKPKQFRRTANRSASVGPNARNSFTQNEIAYYRRKIANNQTAVASSRLNSTFYQRAIKRDPALEKDMRDLSIFVKQANINITEAVNKQAYELAVQFCDQLIRKLTDDSNRILPLFQSRLNYLADTYCIKACLLIKLQSPEVLYTFEQAVDAAEQSSDAASLLKINREYGKALMNMNYYRNALNLFKQVFSYTQDRQIQADLNYSIARCHFELKDYDNTVQAGVKAYQELAEIFHEEYPETELPAIMEYIIFREPRVCDIVCDLLCLIGRTFYLMGDAQGREYLEKCCEISRKYEDVSALRAAETALKLESNEGVKTLPQILANDLAKEEEEAQPEGNLRQLIDQQLSEENGANKPHAESVSTTSENGRDSQPYGSASPTANSKESVSGKDNEDHKASTGGSTSLSAIPSQGGEVSKENPPSADDFENS